MLFHWSRRRCVVRHEANPGVVRTLHTGLEVVPAILQPAGVLDGNSHAVPQMPLFAAPSVTHPHDPGIAAMDGFAIVVEIDAAEDSRILRRRRQNEHAQQEHHCASCSLCHCITVSDCEAFPGFFFFGVLRLPGSASRSRTGGRVFRQCWNTRSQSLKQA